MRQNLALVVGLQGRFAEAEQIARSEISPKQAEANITYLRSMMSPAKRLGKAERQGQRQEQHELALTCFTGLERPG